MKQRILSGMRPTGRLHLGNYHGALANWVGLQDKYECYFFVADWHSLTTEYESPDQIKNWTSEVVLDYLACGLDPKKSTIFIQSMIKEHAELHLLLSMVTPVSWLERTPSYKQMRQELSAKDLSTYGFLGYPMLQTADILLYEAAKVPVGEDQVPHIELAREIVRRFNFLYKGEILTEPHPLLTPTPKVPGLDGRKMSKSFNNCIYLSDSSDELEKKIMPAVTDPARKRRTDPGNPDVCLLFDYHRLYTPPDERGGIDHGCRTAGIGCVDCKRALLKYMNEALDPIRKKRRHFQERPKEVRKIIDDGVGKARAVAEKTMEKVRGAMGVG